MPLYTKESLDLLRQRIRLSDVVSSYLSLKKSGSTYKALCPFHEEKTPSFIVQEADSYYHCFGCGAHGDAIAFLMNLQKLSFVEAIECLAEKFGVVLERAQEEEKKGPSKTELRNVLERAAQFYHYLLLYSEEAVRALGYLYERGIDLEFIRKFHIGYAPIHRKTLQRFLGEDLILLETAGLITQDQRDFFHERITIPIRDALGHVIGFSARKFKEETFGGKYTNTPETPLFKKSHTLFGLNNSRKRIMKEKKALIVEGQIDCLRLIHQGFDWAVAGQGTAFGKEHVHLLVQLGVQSVYLALDADSAGEEATVKIGDLFQKSGIEVWVLQLPSKKDPDAILREEGVVYFENLLKEPMDYITFLVKKFSQGVALENPALKHQLVEGLIDRIRGWEKPVLVHESLQKLSQLMNLPADVVRVGAIPPMNIQKRGHITQGHIDADKILETDLLRLLFFSEGLAEELITMSSRHLQPNQLKVSICRRLYALVLEKHTNKEKVDLLLCAAGLEQEQDSNIIVDMMQRKMNPYKLRENLYATLQRILERNWLEEKERIKEALCQGNISDEEALQLAKQFDQLKRPTILLTVES